MNFEHKQLPAGLYFVATPIGAARDITLRALDILASADVIAAEDTRTARHLMEIHAIPLNKRPLIAYHDHNGAERRPRLLRALTEGKSVAYVSEAGTPLISDPGYGLGQAAIATGVPVLAAPGASAVLAALAVSGLPTDRFFFAGFAPTAKGQRIKFLKELAQIPGTIIFYESPKRIQKILADLVQCFGEDRQAAVCRELTKKFEETVRGTLGELAGIFSNRAVKGEIVILVDRQRNIEVTEETVEDLLRDALGQSSLKDAVAHVSEVLSVPRRRVYQAALKLEKEI